MKKSRFFIAVLALIVSLTASAQKRTLSGLVVDNTNEPVIGASVVEKGTTNGAVTDIDGRFTVSVEPGTTLVVSYISYLSQEVQKIN